jgi:shikimate dehydrogenase
MFYQRFAVIGTPIAHSLSPLIHYLFAKQTQIKIRYDKLISSESTFARDVQHFFKTGGSGLNITLPFKELAYNLSSTATLSCQQAKAANTLWFKNGQIHAANTDGIGLVQDLTQYLEIKNKTILIIGAGGAARAIISELIKTKVHLITICNRTTNKLDSIKIDFPTIFCSNYLENKKFDLIINTTSSAAEFVQDQIIANAKFCYDINYYKLDNSLCTRASKLGIKNSDGFGMLVNQASLSFAIWHEQVPNSKLIASAIKRHFD